MTDRLKGVWVAFERDIRDDDAEAIIKAIRMIRHVAAVKGNIADSNDWINRMQIRTELGEKLWAVLYPKEKT